MDLNENVSPDGTLSDIDFGFKKVSPDNHKAMVGDVFSSVAGRYDLMNDLMSGGLHRLWKIALLNRLNPRGDELLIDVAGGTGDIAESFLKRGGGSAVICDINFEMLTAGINRSLDQGKIEGPARICGDAAALPIPSKFADSCTIVFGLRNVSHRSSALKEMRRILKPGGHFICMEFSPAVMPLLKPLYDTYSFRVLPWLGARVANDREAYEYLAESIRTFPDPPVLSAEMQEAGFGNVSETPMSGGIVWLHSGWRV